MPKPKKIVSLNFITDPMESAKNARLSYTTDTMPGIIRKKVGNEFQYFDVDGKLVRKKKTLARIKSLGIPPAWRQVWICKSSRGHLQATGLDDRDRKQYRYHPRWREVRDETKYDRMIAFGHALPKIRKKAAADLQLPDLPKEKVLATVVQLLEKTLIRVGNDEYARENNSYGLTTMRDKHIEIRGKKITFDFKGKSGVEHTISLEDPELAKIIKKCQEIPGYELFQYIDGNGEKQTISSQDVNDYLKSITGEDFTAKDFRTWYGTVLAAEALKAMQSFDSETQAKKNIVAAIESVAKQLGNTKAICRKCYVHPAILDSYMHGSLIDQLQCEIHEAITDDLDELSPEEAAVMVFLQQRLEEKEKQQKS